MHLGIEGKAASGKVGYFFAAVFLRGSTHRFFISCDNRLPPSALKWPHFWVRPVRRCSTFLAAPVWEGLGRALQPHRFNSAIGYITPKDMLAGGHQQEIQADRDRTLEAAKEQRKNRRQRAA
jgi:hypothetical protein